MLKKTCPHCHSNSYSSTTRGLPWLCPECGADLTDIPTEPPLPPKPEPEKDTSFKGLIKKFLKKIQIY